MARRGTDGSIILDVTIDEKGLTKGTNSIKTAFDKVNNYLKNVGAKIGNNFKKVGSSIKNTFTKLTASLKGLAGQILAFFSIRALLQFSNEASKMASTTEASVQRLIDIYGKASIAVGDFIDANARAIGMSKSAAASFSAVYGNLFSVWADQKTNAELTTQYLNMTAVVASKTGRTVEDVQERIRSGLLGNTEAIEDLGVFVNIKTIEITDAFQRMANGKSWEQLDAYTQQQIRTIAILEQATQKYGNQVAQTTALTRAQYNAAFQDFKKTWGQVVNLVLMPILRIATRILNTLTAGLRVLAGLSGKTIDNNKQIEEQTDHIGGAVDNQEALTDAVKDTAKEQKKLLAGFDDLEILSQKAASSGNGASDASGVGVGTTSTTDTSAEVIDEAEYTSKLALIGSVTGWALVGLGIIVMFSGHPLIGVGMAAAGYLLVVGTAEGGKELGEEEKQKLITIGAITGVALLGLGVLVLFTKFWKVGLGMVASGAAALYEALALGEFSQDVKSKITNILVLTGTVLLTLGVILLFVPGAEGFGLKMLAMGAMELFAAAVMNWETLKAWISENCWAIVGEIGKFIFMVGIILLFVPNMMYVGFGAMIAGLAILAISEIAPNYETLKSEIANFFKDNWEAIALVSTVLLIIGIILLFCGHPLIGFALLGIASPMLWNSVGPNNKEIMLEIKNFFVENKDAIAVLGEGLLILGIILLFVPGTLGIGLGLIAAGIGSLSILAVSMDDFDLKDKLKTLLNGLITIIEDFLNFATGGIRDLANSATSLLNSIGGAIGLDWDIPSIPPIKLPRLARGAVIPPNREFLAVLGDQKSGTNIEAPLQTIVDAFNIALQGNANIGGSNTEVILELDGRELGRAVVEQGNKENRRIGTRLVIA